jgi:hypothetical protein
MILGSKKNAILINERLGSIMGQATEAARLKTAKSG